MKKKCKKAFKVFSILAAIVGIGAAIYLAVTKLKAKPTPEYFDDNDFFECDNEIEVVEVKDDEKAEEKVENSAEEKKEAPKKAEPKKATKKSAPKKASNKKSE